MPGRRSRRRPGGVSRRNCREEVDGNRHANIVTRDLRQMRNCVVRASSNPWPLWRRIVYWVCGVGRWQLLSEVWWPLGDSRRPIYSGLDHVLPGGPVPTRRRRHSPDPRHGQARDVGRRDQRNDRSRVPVRGKSETVPPRRTDGVRATLHSADGDAESMFPGSIAPVNSNKQCRNTRRRGRERSAFRHFRKARERPRR
jgi:hypothetical protein